MTAGSGINSAFKSRFHRGDIHRDDSNKPSGVEMLDLARNVLWNLEITISLAKQTFGKLRRASDFDPTETLSS